MSNDRFSFYKEYPKTCEPNDFWGQVKRTVNGVAVSQDQIDMIVDAAVAGLELNDEDVLLDLCCGNGALSSLLFSRCNGGVGVDFSAPLISVAKNNFSVSPAVNYALCDAIDYCRDPRDKDNFTKLICYGAFSYLEHDRAEELLRLLDRNFPRLKRIFIGNLPDKDLMGEFFKARHYQVGVENDPASSIGIWRTKKEFENLVSRCGWKASFYKMPEGYYAHHYRYDAVLHK